MSMGKISHDTLGMGKRIMFDMRSVTTMPDFVDIDHLLRLLRTDSLVID